MNGPTIPARGAKGFVDRPELPLSREFRGRQLPKVAASVHETLSTKPCPRNLVVVPSGPRKGSRPMGFVIVPSVPKRVSNSVRPQQGSTFMQ